MHSVNAVNCDKLIIFNEINCPHLSCVIKIFVKVCFCTKMDLLAILVNAWTKVAATLGRDKKI